MNFTTKETEMIKAFYMESVNCCGECSEDENMSYMNARDLQEEIGGSMQSIGGLMSSLDAKGVIVDTVDSARGLKLTDWVLCPLAIPELLASFEE